LARTTSSSRRVAIEDHPVQEQAALNACFGQALTWRTASAVRKAVIWAFPSRGMAHAVEREPQDPETQSPLRSGL
jgi:hypothetical protein